MKILVFSDSHGNFSLMEKALKNEKNADIIYHLGDNVRDAKKLQEIAHIPVKYVKGNCDYDGAPIYLIEEIEGIRIFLTHGHAYSVRGGMNKLYYAAKENNIDLSLFGHTHVPYVEKEDDITFFNPGSIGDKRWQKNESYGIIEITDKKLIITDIIEIW